MKFNLSNLDGNRKEMSKLFLEKQGYETSREGIIVLIHEVEERLLKVEFGENELHLYGKEEVHFYRGLHLFLQEMKNGYKASFKKEEKVYFEEAGIMIDCSRNGTVDKPLLKEFIGLCAACGMNQLYLYMEDVYEIPDNPYFGAYRGKYTYQDLKELDEYGCKAGVELIPAIQTLAHLHTYLRWSHTKKIQDTEDILLVGSKETQEFIRQMIQNVSRPFSSPKIHVGMDEADLLGLGQYLRINGYEERYGVMSKHLNMVYGICKEEGLEPMIWSDMYFRLKSATGDYYDLPENTEFDLLEPLPKDLDLVYWDYYHHEKRAYDKNIRLHNKLTDKIRFAGGGWTWNGIAPNYSKAEKTLNAGMASSREQGIDKVMCTFWFDNGTETPVRTAFYSALYFSQLCYHEEVDYKNLNFWLEQLTGFKRDAYLLLDAFDSPHGVKTDNENADNPSKYMLYQDVLMGLFDGQIEGNGMDMDQYYRKLADQIELQLSKGKAGSMESVFSYYHTLAELLSEKAMIGINIRRAYQSGEKETLLILKEQIKRCIVRISILKEKREQIWFEECRPFGFEVLDIRLGGVKIRLESAEKRLQSYLDGKVTCIEELEEPMILYLEDIEDINHKLCQGGFWQNMVSAGNIAGI